ncbi:MAG: Vitamin B12 transporter BtuB [bacterium]|nr:Vitamin B12 transporter BtuB [bacterium]
MLNRFLAIAAMLLLLGHGAMAQNGKIIRGQVTDAQTGRPLPGANVFFINGAGTNSDANGRFRFKIGVAANDSLRISFMGYRPAAIAIGDVDAELQIKLTATTVLFAETIVTATRQATVRAAAPAATELVEINSPQILARQNVGEALAAAQSIFVKEYGSVSGLKTINLRGASDGQILVLADGVRLNNPQTGAIDASLLSLAGIEKIEIVRGNASAQYGSDAIGGVIHLRSFQPPAGWASSIQTGGGSFGTFNSRVQFGYGRKNWNGAVTLDRLVSDGDFPITATGHNTRQNNNSQRREILARFAGNPRDDLHLQLWHRTNRTELGVPGSLQFPSPAARQRDLNHLTSAALEWNKNSRWQVNAQFSTERRDERYTDPDPFFPAASRHRVATDFGSLQNRAQLHQTLDLLAGAEIGYFRINSTDLGKPERTQRSGFVQAEWKPWAAQRQNVWQLQVIPSWRYDDYSDAGQRTSPKLAVALNRQALTKLNLHGSVGKSFRVPGMNDLFWPAGPYLAGNPHLSPERGREIEGGVLYEFSRAGNWQLELAGFNSRIDGLIVWISDVNFRYMPVNLANAKINGVELSTAWRSDGDRLGWRANYTRLVAKNDGDDPLTNGKDLVYRPRDKFDLQAYCHWHDFTFSGSFQYTGKRFNKADNSATLPAYRVTTIALSRSLRFGEFNALLHAEVRNLFDKHFSIIDGYPLPGREIRGMLKLGF